MNITFLIGNGFDRNLGLATTYAEFVEHYKNTERASGTLKQFRADIAENEELWSSAEVALGCYTERFEPGDGASFTECHIDICEALASYLKDEQARVDYTDKAKEVQRVCQRMDSIISPFPTQERNALNNVFSNKVSEERVYNFICFNYTDTLDRLIDIARTQVDSLGYHRYGSSVLRNKIGELCHVHGTVDKEMVFGVNDDTQIKRNEIFDCDDGDIYKNVLIKRKANASYLEGTDSKAAALLSNSQIIYIYGMSLGITDKIWWERICTWLDGSSERHLIVQKYSLPSKGVFPVKFQIEERKARREITNYSKWDEGRKRIIEQRIHITEDNIFAAIKDIGKNTAVIRMPEAVSNETDEHQISSVV